MKYSFFRPISVLPTCLLMAICCVLCVPFTACNNEEIGSSEDVNPETVFLDYVIEGTEEGGEAALLMQYRFAGIQGTTLVLSSPSQVTFDGKPVSADSSGTTGAYYEVILPINEFAQPHIVEFTGFDKKTYRDTLNFRPFALADVVPDSLPGTGADFELTGLDSIDHIHVLLTDTASFSKGIDRVDTVRNGMLHLTAAQLTDIADGPVVMELFRESESRLRQTPREGGRLRLSYSLKRSFRLVPADFPAKAP